MTSLIYYLWNKRENVLKGMTSIIYGIKKKNVLKGMTSIIYYGHRNGIHC